MAIKVIFDTNALYNTNVEKLFANKLELFSSLIDADLIMPEMVIEELKVHKKELLKSWKDKLHRNPLLPFMEINAEQVKNFDIDAIVADMQNNENVNFEIIKLTDYSILEEMKNLALENRGPFWKKTDRGFKDAYIYFTVLEYLAEHNNQNIYFITNDDRLTKAFGDHKQIMIIKDFDEFKNHFQPNDEHFIIRFTVEIPIIPEDSNVIIESTWISMNENWIFKLRIDNEVIFVELDWKTKEILSYTDFAYADVLYHLVNSGTFASTHEYIARIESYVKYFSSDEIKNVMSAYIFNNQIYLITNDTDVNNFFLQFYHYSKKSTDIPNKLREEFERHFEVLSDIPEFDPSDIEF